MGEAAERCDHGEVLGLDQADLALATTGPRGGTRSAAVTQQASLADQLGRIDGLHWGQAGGAQVDRLDAPDVREAHGQIPERVGFRA